MKKNKTKIIFLTILFFGIFGLAKSSWAACETPCTLSGTTWTCTDISRDCVQDAVIASEASWSAANKIHLNSGSASWSDTGGIECVAGYPFPMCMKRGITFEGAGIDSTIITITSPGPYLGISFYPDSTARTNNEAFDFSNLTIDGNWTYRAGGNLTLSNATSFLMTKARIHHVKFINSGFNATTLEINGIFGVVDNCIFQDSYIWQRSFDNSYMGWDRNLRVYGTLNSVYFEDNTITATGEVLRVSGGPNTEWTVGDTITGVTSGKTATLYAIISAPIYAPTKFYFIKNRSGVFTDEETLTNGTYTATHVQIGNSVGYMMLGQGGSGVLRYNSIDLTYNTDNQMMDIHGLQSMSGAPTDRTCEQYSTVKAEIYGNIWTNNKIAIAYWVVHRGSWLLMFNNPIFGTNATVPRPRAHEYSCDTCQSNESATRWSQHIQNTYSFNNQYNGAEAPYYIDVDDCHTAGGYEITENTDFWNYNANTLNGSTQKGINCGNAAPTSACSVGDGYWQTSYVPCFQTPTTMADMKTYTQAGKLYKCTAPNTWTLYYQPYTYPHPLRASDVVPPSPDTTPPAAPTGLSVN